MAIERVEVTVTRPMIEEAALMLFKLGLTPKTTEMAMAEAILRAGLDASSRFRPDTNVVAAFIA